MKLAKALKVKNKLAGEISQAQKLIEAANVVEGSNARPHDVRKIYSDMVFNQEMLAELKGRISAANVPIARRIFMMSELKGRIAFLRGMSTKDGEFMVEGRYGTDTKFREYRAELTAAWVEEQVRAMSAEIERLQDEIEEHNALTEV